jgi:phage shock protein PspC (stress-responsive transcriptional regulator)
MVKMLTEQNGASEDEIELEILPPVRKRKYKRLDGPSKQVKVKADVEEIVEALAKRLDMQPTALRSILILYGIFFITGVNAYAIPRTKEEYQFEYRRIRSLAKAYFKLDIPDLEDKKKRRKSNERLLGLDL